MNGEVIAPKQNLKKLINSVGKGKGVWRHYEKILLLIPVLALVSACGTSVNIRPEGVSESESAKKLQKLSFTSIAIEIKTEVEDSQDAVEMFNKFLTESFKEKNVKVVVSGTVAEAKMTIVIKHLKKVSKTKRWFLGSMAGSAELKADIAITIKNNSVNFSIDVESRPGFLDLDVIAGYGGSTDCLLEKSSKKIIEEILL